MHDKLFVYKGILKYIFTVKIWNYYHIFIISLTSCGNQNILICIFKYISPQFYNWANIYKQSAHFPTCLLCFGSVSVTPLPQPRQKIDNFHLVACHSRHVILFNQYMQVIECMEYASAYIFDKFLLCSSVYRSNRHVHNYFIPKIIINRMQMRILMILIRSLNQPY